MSNNIKFFDLNKINSSTTLTFTSARTALASYLYDNDLTTQLPSIASNDATTEVWLFEFSPAITINRIFIGNHNIKSGKIEYWNGSAYVDFSTAISWSANATTNNYFEFNSVTTYRVKLTMNTTMVVNAQKVVGQLRCMLELGTLEMNPSNYDQDFPESSALHTGADNGSIYVLFGRKFAADINLSDASNTDVALLKTLKTNGRSFYIYPGGGNTSYAQEGFKIDDMFLVNYTNSFRPNPKAQILGIGSQILMHVEQV